MINVGDAISCSSVVPSFKLVFLVKRVLGGLFCGGSGGCGGGGGAFPLELDDPPS